MDLRQLLESKGLEKFYFLTEIAINIDIKEEKQWLINKIAPNGRISIKE